MYYCLVVEKVCKRQDPSKSTLVPMLVCFSQIHSSTNSKQFQQQISKVDCGGVKTAPCLGHGAADGHLDRRFESAEAASCLLVLDDFLLLNVFDALDATFADVRTEFLGKRKPPFVKGCFPSFEPPKKVYHLISPQSTNLTVRGIKDARKMDRRTDWENAQCACFIRRSCRRAWTYKRLSVHDLERGKEAAERKGATERRI